MISILFVFVAGKNVNWIIVVMSVSVPDNVMKALCLTSGKNSRLNLDLKLNVRADLKSDWQSLLLMISWLKTTRCGCTSDPLSETDWMTWSGSSFLSSD